jgi:hypothetical protein
MSEVRGDDALGGVPFNVSNPAFASGAGSTRVDPVEPTEVEEEVLVFGEVEPPESDDDGIGFLSSVVPDPDADESVSATEATEEAGDDSEERSDDESAQADDGGEGDEGGEENEPTVSEETTTDVPDGEV